MDTNGNIKSVKISEDEVKKLIAIEEIVENSEMLYIVPEITGERDIINEYSPDLFKVAKIRNIPCKVIYNKENYEYLSLRDAEILLPFIISLAASACYDLLKCFILRYCIEKKNLRVRLITKKKRDTEYRKVEIKGDAESVIKALDILEEEEKNGV